MKRFLAFVLTVVIIALSLSACKSDNNSDSDKLTLYVLENQWGGMGNSAIYYVYNRKASEKDKIELVAFESVQAMKDKLSSELMAGKGPDIILDETLMMTGLSVQKLIEADSFLDLNELNLDLSSCRQNTMNGSDKRLFIPSFYSPKYWVCCEEDIRDIVSGDVLSYDELIALSENTDKKLFPDSTFNDSYILNYVVDNVDFDNKTFDFGTEEFKTTIEKLKELYIRENSKQGDDYIFDVYAHGSPYDTYTVFARIENEGKTPAVVGTPSLNHKLGAYYIGEISINKNINRSKLESAKKFLQFAMSEKYQNEITGADIEQYNTNFSYTTGNMFPMNTKVFEKLMSNADSFAYNTSGEYEPDGSDTPRTDEPQAKISEKSIKLLHDKLDSIQYYEMNTYTIGYNVVIQDIIADYYDGKISVDSLVSQLKSKTQIYLEE